MRNLEKRRPSKWETPEQEEENLFTELLQVARRYWAGLAVSIAVLGLIIGLAKLLTRGDRPGEVTGRVTVDGRPIPWGRVTFVGEAGKKEAVSGMIKNGVFKVKRCPAGPTKVSVESMRVFKTPQRPPTGIARGFASQEAADKPPPEAAGKHLVIPAAYGNADTSGLRYEVRSGSQTHDISLPHRR